jgi:hypothetical protein
MRLFRILLDDASTDGGNTPAPTGTPPPAAKAVIESDAKPEDAAEMVDLRRKLADAESAKKKVEMDNAQLADEVRRLSTPPAPAPAKDERGDLEKFFDGDL